MENAAMAVEEAEAAEAELFADDCSGVSDPLGFPDDGVFVHVVLGTVHKYVKDNRAGCGMQMKEDLYFFTLKPEDIDGCARCWRPGCAPWHGISRE